MIEGIGKVYLGTKEIVKAYLGNKVVYNSAQFLPTDIAGCQLWLDASDATTISIGTGVSQWNDKSGNTRNAIQATAASQPAYITAGKNGLNLVRFDGSNDGLQGAFTTLSEHTIFAAFDNNSGANGRVLSFVVVGETDDFMGGIIPILRSASANTIASYSASLANFYNGLSYNNNPAIIKIIRDSTNTTNYLQSNSTSRANLSLGTVDRYRLGFNTITDGRMNGDIYEVIIYNSVLSGANQTAVETYLSTKWAI
jgi:hypothetical protein